uniref:Uncharacterized protein n=1 Tax=Rhizophora mucronata TaxID=61149 RepID=A0A2P2Q229_RHIMU
MCITVKRLGIYLFLDHSILVPSIFILVQYSS